MKVNEIFLSIQGEGYNSGLPTIFIRFTGCNLRCSYCDTVYAYEDGFELRIEEILKKIQGYGYKRICLTGGEPLMQKDIGKLISELGDYEVSIETNGSIPIKDFKMQNNHKFVMDVKTPSSGESKNNQEVNMSVLKEKDEIKFVIGDRKDYDFSKEFLKKYYKKGLITFSGVYNSIDSIHIVNWILEDKLDIRFQIQLHKIIWGENKTGV